jgi:uncharacterized membrane protein
MDKTRAEAFSDGVFAIAMTLLVFDIKLPTVVGAVTNAQLWGIILTLSPLIASFVLSFLVLAVFWINHNFLFHSFMKKMDRYLNLMNMLYLLFLVFIPFSANLFGTYPFNQPAALVYGFNILAVMTMSAMMTRHLGKHPELRNVISKRLRQQGRIRTRLTQTSYVLGLIATFVYIPASIFFYIFPLIFNIIPGTLDLAEKYLPFELAKEGE